MKIGNLPDIGIELAKSNLKLIGFEKLKDILDPTKFERRLKRHVRTATLKNGLIAESEIKDKIDKGKIKSPRRGKSANADLTVAMKGSDRPLVDTGGLKQSINSEVKSWDLVLVGVLRNRVITDSQGRKKGVVEIARALHDGAKIKVTSKMRKYFFWLAHGKDSPFRGMVKPLKASTKIILIPPRPFMHVALTHRMIKKYTENWRLAVRKVMQGKN